MLGILTDSPSETATYAIQLLKRLTNWVSFGRKISGLYTGGYENIVRSYDMLY